MREITALVFALLMLGVGIHYCSAILRRVIPVPVLTTWLMFAVAVSLSFFTYLSTEKHSLVSNIGNTVDIAFSWSILASIAIRRLPDALRFSTLEKRCLGGTVIIFFLWIGTGNSVLANLAIQGILVLGYLPMIQRLWCASESTESFSFWATLCIASIIALYPPLHDRDLLAIVYAGRAVISSWVVIGLILRLKRRKAKP